MKLVIDISKEDLEKINKEYKFNLVDMIKNGKPIEEEIEELKQLDYELWVRTSGYSHLDEKQWDWLIEVSKGE